MYEIEKAKEMAFVVLIAMSSIMVLSISFVFFAIAWSIITA